MSPRQASKTWSLLTASLLAAANPAWPHGGNSAPNAVHACISNKDGATRIVGVTGTCKSNETAAHWNLTGPAGPPGSAGPSVYDAQDRRVGTVTSLSQSLGLGLIGTVPVVILDLDGVLVPLRVIREGFEGGIDRSLFSSLDCSGDAFLETAFVPGELFPAAFVIDPSIVYIHDVAATSVNFTIGSVMFRDGQCVTGGNGIGSAVTGRPTLPAIDLATQYTPPFRVQ